MIANLYHCLGGGQALKYAPVFGELIAESILRGSPDYQGLTLDEFSIARFDMKNPLDLSPAVGGKHQDFL